MGTSAAATAHKSLGGVEVLWDVLICVLGHDSLNAKREQAETRCPTIDVSTQASINFSKGFS